MSLENFVKTFTGRIVFWSVGLLLCLSSAAVALSLLSWVGIILSMGSFFIGFAMIYYTIINNRKT